MQTTFCPYWGIGGGGVLWSVRERESMSQVDNIVLNY